jgi:hypothetical protein
MNSLKVHSEPRIFRMHIFESYGNRFAFSGTYSYYMGTEEELFTPEYDCSSFASLGMMGLDIKYTGEHLDIPATEEGEIVFEHLKGEIHSSRFMHGGATVFYLSGPLFDEAKARM